MHSNIGPHMHCTAPITSKRDSGMKAQGQRPTPVIFPQVGLGSEDLLLLKVLLPTPWQSLTINFPEVE